MHLLSANNWTLFCITHSFTRLWLDTMILLVAVFIFAALTQLCIVHNGYIFVCFALSQSAVDKPHKPNQVGCNKKKCKMHARTFARLPFISVWLLMLYYRTDRTQQKQINIKISFVAFLFFVIMRFSSKNLSTFHSWLEYFWICWFDSMFLHLPSAKTTDKKAYWLSDVDIAMKWHFLNDTNRWSKIEIEKKMCKRKSRCQSHCSDNVYNLNLLLVFCFFNVCTICTSSYLLISNVMKMCFETQYFNVQF